MTAFRIIESALNGTFPGGTVMVFGLAENGVGYVYDANNTDLIPEEVRRQVEEIREAIIAGTIEVPAG